MNNIENLDSAYKVAVADQRTAEAKLAAMPKDDPAREGVKAQLDALVVRLRALKEGLKRESTRRNFAGIGSPLYEACVARFPAEVIAELESDAVSRQAERERRAEQRRASKQVQAAAARTLPLFEQSAPRAPPKPAPKPPPPTVPPLPPAAKYVPRADHPFRRKVQAPTPEVHIVSPSTSTARSTPTAPTAPPTPPTLPQRRPTQGRSSEVRDFFASSRKFGG